MARVVLPRLPHHVTQRGDRAEPLRLMAEPQVSDRLRRHVRTGRPRASRSFVETAERLLGRHLRPRPAGRPSKTRK